MSQAWGGRPPNLLQWVHDIVPLIAEGAADAEEQRKPDDEVMAALQDTGVFRSR